VSSNSSNEDPIAAKGTLLTVRYARHTNGHCYAQEFLNEVAELKPKFIAIFRQYADSGMIRNEKHGHMLRGAYSKLLEFTNRSGRVMAFRRGATCYLTNGATKKKPREQNLDYDRAMEIMTGVLTRPNQRIPR
jgi:hypothetical protein